MKNQYWEKMYILKKQINKFMNMDLFISQDAPIVIKNNNKYFLKCLIPLSQEEITELSEFYSRNYKINDFIQFIDIQYIIKLIKFNTFIARLFINDNLIGAMVCFNFPVKIVTNLSKKRKLNFSENFKKYLFNDDIEILSCSSLFAIEKRERGKGLGMSIIQESLKIFYDHGGLIAYFINKISRCHNSIPINHWYYPINFKKLDEIYYNYPNNYKSRFIEKPGKFFYSEINESNIYDVYKFVINYMDKKSFCFYPTLDYFKLWCNTYPSYYIYDINNNIMGYVNYNFLNTKYMNKLFIAGHVIYFIGIEEIMETVVNITRNKCDILFFYEIGDINSKSLFNIFCQKTSDISYINFYNTNIKINGHEFYLPIL